MCIGLIAASNNPCTYPQQTLMSHVSPLGLLHVLESANVACACLSTHLLQTPSDNSAANSAANNSSSAKELWLRVLSIVKDTTLVAHVTETLHPEVIYACLLQAQHKSHER